MTILIIVLAVALVLGSAMWVLPSPRERQQMGLRREAMSKGLQVQLKKIKDAENPAEKIACAAYSLPRTGKPAAPGDSWMLLRDPRRQPDDQEPLAGWISERSQGGLPPLLEHSEIGKVLATLPPEVLAVQSTPASTAVYWNERGDSALIDRIQTALSALQQLPHGS